MHRNPHDEGQGEVESHDEALARGRDVDSICVGFLVHVVESKTGASEGVGCVEGLAEGGKPEKECVANRSEHEHRHGAVNPPAVGEDEYTE